MIVETNIIEDIHFYPNRLETIIKEGVWIIAIIGSIVVPFFFNEKSTMGSAYFLFSLSILMEFVPRIIKNTTWFVRLVHGIFCLLSISILVFSILMILGKTEKFSLLLLILCFIIMFFLVVDICIALFAPSNMFKDELSTSKEDTILTEEVKKFLELQSKGNLGNIEGDGSNDS